MAVFHHAVGSLTVHLIEAGMANYIYVVEWDGGCLVVDPAEATTVTELLTARGWTPSAILATHHHADHVAGIPELKRIYDCEVIGPAGSGIRGMDREVRDGDEVAVGPLSLQVMETPGHTSTDVSYYCQDPGLLFCGDTLFSAGCGRLFECGADVMWRSLDRLRRLPEPTFVFCGHEYTEGNLRFAGSLMPQDEHVGKRLRHVRDLRASGRPTIPTTIGAEKQMNLFLRTDDLSVQEMLGLAGASSERVFAELRLRKDRF